MHKALNKKVYLTLFLFFIPLIIFAQDAESSALNNLAAQIAEKRSQVETLSNQLSLTKTEYNEQLRSIATQKTDIETQIKREEISLEQIRRDTAEFEDQIKKNRESIVEIKPVLLNTIEELIAYIKSGIPFQTDERVSEAQDLKTLIETGSADTGVVLARFWNLLESEFRLTTENGIYRQQAVIDGEQQLVEVARLGMVLLYFKTFDEKYGYALRTETGPEYTVLKDRTQQKQIETLFDSIRKNLREGFFELPNPMTAEQE